MTDFRSRVRRTLPAVPIAVAAVVAGLAAPTSAASGDQQVDAALSYSCAFPAAEYRVDVGLTATFPTAREVGSPVAPTGVALDVTIPEAAAADLAELGAATVDGTASLDVQVRGVADSSTLHWSELGVPSTPVPDPGTLTVTGTGAVPPITVDEAGDTVFVASTMNLTLTPHNGDGSATEPASLQISCDLEPEQEEAATLATVVVSGTGSPTTSSARPSKDGPDADPTNGRDQQPQPDASSSRSDPRPLQDSETPPECFNIPGDSTIAPYCAYMSGYSNVKKLNGAVKFSTSDPGFLDFAIVDSVVDRPCEEPPDVDWECIYTLTSPVRATLDLPAAESTLLTFGFMPVRAKVKLSMAEKYIRIQSVLMNRTCPSCEDNDDTFALNAVADVNMNLRLYDVTVNGVPLDVGDNCSTVEPLQVDLHGRSDSIRPGNPDEYNIQFGGALRGFATIPNFSGCGSSENLDPLLSGLVSGPGNYVKMMQGRPCDTNGGGCPPEVPQPRR